MAAAGAPPRRGAALLPIRRENDNEQQRLQWVMSRMVEAPASWKEIIDALAAVADLGIAEGITFLLADGTRGTAGITS